MSHEMDDESLARSLQEMEIEQQRNEQTLRDAEFARILAEEDSINRPWSSNPNNAVSFPSNSSPLPPYLPRSTSTGTATAAAAGISVPGTVAEGAGVDTLLGAQEARMQIRSGPFTLRVGQAAPVCLQHPATGNRVNEPLYAQVIASQLLVFVLVSAPSRRLRVLPKGVVEYSTNFDEATIFNTTEAPDSGLYLACRAFAHKTPAGGGRFLKKTPKGWFLSMSSGGKLSGNGQRNELARWVFAPIDHPLQTERNIAPSSDNNSNIAIVSGSSVNSGAEVINTFENNNSSTHSAQSYRSNSSVHYSNNNSNNSHCNLDGVGSMRSRDVAISAISDPSADNTAGARASGTNTMGDEFSERERIPGLDERGEELRPPAVQPYYTPLPSSAEYQEFLASSGLGTVLAQSNTQQPTRNPSVSSSSSSAAAVILETENSRIAPESGFGGESGEHLHVHLTPFIVTAEATPIYRFESGVRRGVSTRGEGQQRGGGPTFDIDISSADAVEAYPEEAHAGVLVESGEEVREGDGEGERRGREWEAIDVDGGRYPVTAVALTASSAGVLCARSTASGVAAFNIGEGSGDGSAAETGPQLATGAGSMEQQQQLQQQPLFHTAPSSNPLLEAFDPLPANAHGLETAAATASVPPSQGRISDRNSEALPFNNRPSSSSSISCSLSCPVSTSEGAGGGVMWSEEMSAHDSQRQFASPNLSHSTLSPQRTQNPTPSPDPNRAVAPPASAASRAPSTATSTTSSSSVARRGSPYPAGVPRVSSTQNLGVFSYSTGEYASLMDSDEHKIQSTASRGTSAAADGASYYSSPTYASPPARPLSFSSSSVSSKVGSKKLVSSANAGMSEIKEREEEDAAGMMLRAGGHEIAQNHRSNSRSGMGGNSSGVLYLGFPGYGAGREALMRYFDTAEGVAFLADTCPSRMRSVRARRSRLLANNADGALSITGRDGAQRQQRGEARGAVEDKMYEKGAYECYLDGSLCHFLYRPDWPQVAHRYEDLASSCGSVELDEALVDQFLGFEDFRYFYETGYLTATRAVRNPSHTSGVQSKYELPLLSTCGGTVGAMKTNINRSIAGSSGSIGVMRARPVVAEELTNAALKVVNFWLGKYTPIGGSPQNTGSASTVLSNDDTQRGRDVDRERRGKETGDDGFAAEESGRMNNTVLRMRDQRVEVVGDILQDIDLLALYYKSPAVHIVQRLLGSRRVLPVRAASRVITTYPSFRTPNISPWGALVLEAESDSDYDDEERKEGGIDSAMRGDRWYVDGFLPYPAERYIAQHHRTSGINNNYNTNNNNQNNNIITRGSSTSSSSVKSSEGWKSNGGAGAGSEPLQGVSALPSDLPSSSSSSSLSSPSPSHSPCSLVVGVALTDMCVRDSGNFCVHPGSPLVLMEAYKEQVKMADTLFSDDPDLRRKPDLGSPTQLLLHKGDIFVCSARMAYQFAANTHPQSSSPTSYVLFAVSHAEHAILREPALQSLWVEFQSASLYLQGRGKGKAGEGGGKSVNIVAATAAAYSGVDNTKNDWEGERLIHLSTDAESMESVENGGQQQRKIGKGTVELSSGCQNSYTEEHSQQQLLRVERDGTAAAAVVRGKAAGEAGGEGREGGGNVGEGESDNDSREEGDTGDSVRVRSVSRRSAPPRPPPPAVKPKPRPTSRMLSSNPSPTQPFTPLSSPPPCAPSSSTSVTFDALPSPTPPTPIPTSASTSTSTVPFASYTATHAADRGEGDRGEEGHNSVWRGRTTPPPPSSPAAPAVAVIASVARAERASDGAYANRNVNVFDEFFGELTNKPPTQPAIEASRWSAFAPATNWGQGCPNTKDFPVSESAWDAGSITTLDWSAGCK